MSLTSQQIEHVFRPVSTGRFGLGIIETGSVAGGLSSLFSIGFEILGYASVEIEADDLVIKCARFSRLFGDIAQQLAEFIPAIPPVVRSEVLSFGGRLSAFSANGLYQEFGALGAVSFARGVLCEFLSVAIPHYISRCSELSDKSFSRALSAALTVVDEARDEIDAKGFHNELTRSNESENLRAFEEILDLSWFE